MERVRTTSDEVVLRDPDVTAFVAFHQWPANRSLGRHVTNDESMAATGEPAVRDQGDVGTQPPAHDSSRRAQHFPHPGRTPGAFVADDDDVPGDDLPVENRLQRLLLGMEKDKKKIKVVLDYEDFHTMVQNSDTVPFIRIPSDYSYKIP